jgi:hypothetical protein
MDAFESLSENLEFEPLATIEEVNFLIASR